MNGARSETSHRVGRSRLRQAPISSMATATAKWRTGAAAVSGPEVSRRLQSASRSFLLPSAHTSCCKEDHTSVMQSPAMVCTAVDVIKCRQALFALMI